MTTPPTNQVTVNFGFDGLPKTATNVKSELFLDASVRRLEGLNADSKYILSLSIVERAQGVRIIDLYEGMIAL